MTAQLVILKNTKTIFFTKKSIHLQFTKNKLKMETTLKTESATRYEERMRSINIHFSLEIKNTFELYSYRIVDHTTFANRIDELIQTRDDQYTKNKAEFTNQDESFETGEDINNFK